MVHPALRARVFAIALTGVLSCAPRLASADAAANAAYGPGAERQRTQPERIEIPRDIRQPTEPPLSGQDLLQHLRDRYRQRFDAADVQGAGRITKEQARRAGWGYVVRNFDAMDGTGSGTVGFSDIMNFMRRNGAGL
ncbi:hypothetical protein BZL54_10265 [Burkholderia ubonensis subsp. mesacidophila]|uniref:EF-hand domain-containing protein n=2 Tax=Burkholderia ubonensis TaxID=101571 RepID=A0A2A4FHI7_9BURK|nr:hypothetical protein BZL54_10265 [Burkholderia ubonensis subsp. mesacidophila]